MRIFFTKIDRPRKAAKSLKQNFELGPLPIVMPITWHQDTIAKMLGHADWKALLTSVKETTDPSPMDEDVGDEEVAARLKFQTSVLLGRLDADVVERLGVHHFETIVAHIAPSGRPRAGTAFQIETRTLTAAGISIPISLDNYTEDALFRWHDIRSQGNYAHVADRYDPAVEPLCELLSGELTAEVISRCMQYAREQPDDDLDGLAILTRLALTARQTDAASHFVMDAFIIGSHAWAPIARERRRCHDPVRWWEEKSTRPFMRVVHAMALVNTALGEVDTAAEQFGVLLALNPDDPLGVRPFAKTEFIFYDKQSVEGLMRDLSP